MTRGISETATRDSPDRGLPRQHYVAIAEFRHRLRSFLAFSERAATEAGLPPQQHQALLAIAGHAGDGPPSVGALARHLLIAPHSAAELVRRMERAGLLQKAPAAEDRRRVELVLTSKADALLRRLTPAHVEELQVLEPALCDALRHLRRDGREPARDGPGCPRSSDR